MRAVHVLLVLAVALAAPTVRAQPPGDAAARVEAKCVRAAPPPPPASPDAVAPPPVTWSGFELQGKFVEDAAT
ncbi:MAG TPA: hypothetical protein VM513_29375, partial [Kofleriaceae bacterium]|nr:hypothetical protein [Kofleriaceae bacterium]